MATFCTPFASVAAHSRFGKAVLDDAQGRPHYFRYLQIMAAGAAHPADMPGVNHFDLTSRHEQYAHIRRAGWRPAQRLAVMDHGAQHDPFGEIDAAAIGPAPGQAEAAVRAAQLGPRRNLTVSAGVATSPDSRDDRDRLVREADGHLMRAKREGRDRVVLGG